ncbi:zinc finger and BTB domain-containing protein 41 [Musca domestica]|uniref:Zinc finger and BTB domain-containing protein 41 n=1 Tax=Musca domestica TaxID=7370 RepID=A0A1I8M6B4_MUSDO|nr:zinc finger and BTB domain-containing protein 41 [Musca domestica]
MDVESEGIDAIEACRTCGVYYMTTTNYLQPLFQSALDYPEMMQIRFELAQWKIEISEHDGLPQYMCNTCIHEFLKIFKFRTACTETQEQLRIFYNMREKNLADIKIKTEVMDPADEAPEYNFIYVDDISDGEYDDNVTPFKVPHVPIKEELIEEANVPCENIKQLHSEKETPDEGGETAPLVYPQTYEPESALVAQEPAIPSVECELCQHLSPNQDEHKQHLQRVHEIRDIECHICGKVFKNSTTSRFKFHLKWHNLNKHVKCTQCGFVCNSRAALKEHRRAQHSKINCKVCGKAILAKKMKSHLRQHEILHKFSCEYCKESFQTNEEKETHIWQVHAQEDDNAQDPETYDPNDVEYDDDDEIIHVELLCAHCDEKFDEQSDLIDHVKQQHRYQQQTMPVIKQEKAEEEENNVTTFEDYGDENSGNQLNDNSQYDQSNEDVDDNGGVEHELEEPTHAELSKYSDAPQDEDCESYNNEDYSQSESMTRNESQDSLENSSSFNESGMEANDSAFDQQSNNNNNDEHLPFACAKCPNKFATIEQLLAHCKQHQNEEQDKSPTATKFSCDICHKEYQLKFRLNLHMRKHAKAAS